MNDFSIHSHSVPEPVEWAVSDSEMGASHGRDCPSTTLRFASLRSGTLFPAHHTEICNFEKYTLCIFQNCKSLPPIGAFRVPERRERSDQSRSAALSLSNGGAAVRGSFQSPVTGHRSSVATFVL